MGKITGKTKITGLFGLPVEHSLSPAIHNAGFKSLNLNYCYLPFRVEEAELATAVKSVRSLGMAGVNVTAPHKQAVMPHLDEVSPEASFLEAVNTIVNEEGRLVGHNTDARGFLAGLQYNVSAGEISEGKALILGGGGAARAAAAGLVQGQMETLFFALRSPEKLEPWQKTFNEAYPEVEIRAVALGGQDFKECLRKATLVINTLPALKDENSQDWFLEILAQARPRAFFSDLRYNPEEPPLLKMANSLGCRVQNGLPMLLEQAVLSFSLFTGVQAPRQAMREAVNL